MVAKLKTGALSGKEENGTKRMDRQQRFWQRMVEKRKSMTLSINRARLVTASYKETEGLPWPIRKAKAFEKLMHEIPIFIEEEDLLAGNQNSEFMGIEWNVEHDCTWVLKEAEKGELWRHFPVRKEDIPEIEEIAKYWENRSRHESYFNWLDQIGLGEEARLLGETEEGTWALFLHTASIISGGHQVPNYEEYLEKGLKGKLAEVEAELQKTIPIGTQESYRKMNFLQALIIVLKAAIHHAHRYAALAGELAGKAQGKRKAELEKMAEMCNRIPENPARTFHEAIQMMWFWRIFEKWEGSYPNVPPGRMDQYLYPFFRRDLDEGKLTREEVLELLECYRAKMSSEVQFLQSILRELTSQAQYFPLTLGGQNAEGDDMTNELSHLILEAGSRIRSPHPNLAIRVHDKTPHDFFLKTLELARLGAGYPSFYNDKSYIPWLLDYGVPLEDARNWCITGCVHPGVPGKNGFDGFFWVSGPKSF